MNQTADLFFTFCKIGAFTFGGGYAMISLLDHECVEKKKWLTSDELMDITVIAESTPGPIAINCATYTGYKIAGMKGAISATIGIILPSFILLLLLSGLFERIQTFHIVSSAFRGIRIAVSILIIQAAMKMIKKVANNSPHKRLQIPIIIFSFLLALTVQIAHVQLSTIYFILCSGLAGLILFGRPQTDRKKEEE